MNAMSACGVGISRVIRLLAQNVKSVDQRGGSRLAANVQKIMRLLSVPVASLSSRSDPPRVGTVRPRTTLRRIGVSWACAETARQGDDGMGAGFLHS